MLRVHCLKGENMRRQVRLAAASMAFCGLAACVTEDTAYNFAYSPPPWACAPAKAGRNPPSQADPCPSDPLESPPLAILRGEPVQLDPRQQETVIVGVTKWLKDKPSASFGRMQGLRDPRGAVVVCGWVDGCNDAGAYRGMSPYIGVLTGPKDAAEFVVVGIGGTARERAEVLSLCQEIGAAPSP
ncbi:MAG: hypothetical protein GEV13_17130 [Rhodospirillales bacterium]|nr:hypothetical protein [Rhodospirillales bacterium]